MGHKKKTHTPQPSWLLCSEDPPGPSKKSPAGSACGLHPAPSSSPLVTPLECRPFPRLAPCNCPPPGRLHLQREVPLPAIAIHRRALCGFALPRFKAILAHGDPTPIPIIGRKIGGEGLNSVGVCSGQRNPSFGGGLSSQERGESLALSFPPFHVARPNLSCPLNSTAPQPFSLCGEFPPALFMVPAGAFFPDGPPPVRRGGQCNGAAGGLRGGVREASRARAAPFPPPTHPMGRLIFQQPPIAPPPKLQEREKIRA